MPVTFKIVAATIVAVFWSCCYLSIASAQPHIDGSLGSYLNFVPQYRKMTLDFENVTESNLNQTVAETPNNEKEVEFGDYDNDGDLDVTMAVGLSDFSQRRNKLYRNDDGILNEVSGSSVIPDFSQSDVARSAFFRDFDHDGFLDLIIVCDGNNGTSNINAPGRTKYFRNVGGETFVNESQRLAGQTGAAGNAVAADFDNNGFCDLVMCNHPSSSQDSIALNNINGIGPGQFEIVTSTHYPTETNYGIHGEAADMNGDGLLDLLVCNIFSQQSQFILYNNNNNAGSGAGDFKYGGTGSASVFDTMDSYGEKVMVPADFNNDGMMDFYFSNKLAEGNLRFDCIMQNMGNDGVNRAMFTEIEMPSGVTRETNKVTTQDLDGDGKLDLIVMSQLGRPYIYRNISVDGGPIKVVEWTPATSFPEGQFSGWHAKADQILGSQRPDLVVGAFNDDFLFENVQSREFPEFSLGGVIPDFHNGDPVSIVGRASTGVTETFVTSDNIPSGATVSIILRSMGDVSLEVVQQSNGQSIAFSDQGFVHTAEGVEFTAPGGDLEIKVTMNRVIYDGDSDGDIDELDKSLMIQCIADNEFMPDCLVFDLSDSYGVTAFDLIEFNKRSTPNQAEEVYVLELNSRTD